MDKSHLDGVPASDYRRTRWRNGLGETAEIARAPDGADLGAFGDGATISSADETVTIAAGDSVVGTPTDHLIAVPQPGGRLFVTILRSLGLGG